MSLDRFKIAQNKYYGQALKEIQSGEKRTHWIWFVFPQIQGLGYSENSRKYAIKDLDEAKEYLKDDLLRKRLIVISEALLKHDKPIVLIMGEIDARKVQSCMTLFHLAEPENKTFKRVLIKFYGRRLDYKTLCICNR